MRHGSGALYRHVPWQVEPCIDNDKIEEQIRTKVFDGGNTTDTRKDAKLVLQVDAAARRARARARVGVGVVVGVAIG